MTDLSTLPLPTNSAPVKQGAVTIDADWWRDEVQRLGLPGAPPVESELSRAEIWAPDVFSTLWRALAWGSGTRNRLNTRRLESIAEDVPRCEDLLTKAADLSRTDPRAAFEVLRPRSNAIRYLGPSFFTKFLHFAGRGEPDHPCLILDRRVATVLHDRCGWTSLHRTGPWPAETYERYCGLLARWAQEAAATPAEIEFCLFNSFSACRN